MQKVLLSFKKEIIGKLLHGVINKQETVRLLGCTPRTVRNYLAKTAAGGLEKLDDQRHSNHHKLTSKQVIAVVESKKTHPWRSARKTIEVLNLSGISPRAIQKIWVKHGVSQLNIERLKPIKRFLAPYPNELWQTDIMGKIDFPFIGTLYLIATLDDYSRFLPAGRWFRTQGKMNVFEIWYESLARFGLPDKMLQDEGNQYKARTRFGDADYQWYAEALKIKLIWAKSAQCKGKIERFWGFVQDDFVPEVWKAKSQEEVNGAFKVWLARYNYKFKSRYFGNQTHASRYQPSERRLSRVELQTLLVVEERRKVTRESTISLYTGSIIISRRDILAAVSGLKSLATKLSLKPMVRYFGKPN